MGNWRTVEITGTMSAADAEALTALLDRGPGYDWPGWREPYACLSFSRARPGLCGIGAWPAVKTSRCGNLAERDYSVEDVRAALESLVTVAPSMLLTVHCGGEYESDECVATVLAGEGLVRTREPMAVTVSEPGEDQILGNLMANLLR